MSLWCVMIRAEELYGDQRKSPSATPLSGGSGYNSPREGSPRAVQNNQPSTQLYGHQLTVPQSSSAATSPKGSSCASLSTSPISIVAKDPPTKMTTLRDILHAARMAEGGTQTDKPVSPPVSVANGTDLSFKGYYQTSPGKTSPGCPAADVNSQEPIYPSCCDGPMQSNVSAGKGEYYQTSPGKTSPNNVNNYEPMYRSCCEGPVQSNVPKGKASNPMPPLIICPESPSNEEILNLTNKNMVSSQESRSSAPPRIFSYRYGNTAAPKPRDLCSLWSQAVTPILEEGLRTTSDDMNSRLVRSQPVSPKASMFDNLHPLQGSLNLTYRSKSDGRISSPSNSNRNLSLRQGDEHCPSQCQSPGLKSKSGKCSPYKPHPRFRPYTQKEAQSTPKKPVRSNNSAPQGNAKFDLFHYLISRALSRPEGAVDADATPSVTIDKPLDLSVKIDFKTN